MASTPQPRAVACSIALVLSDTGRTCAVVVFDETCNAACFSEPEPVERLRPLLGERRRARPGTRTTAREWRQTPSGWEAGVVRALLALVDEKWRPKEEWLAAEQLESA